MISSLYNGISGMKAHQNGIDLVADNISNVNTTGYRAKSPEFSTIFSNALSNIDPLDDPTANDLGYGSVYNGSSVSFGQGSLIESDNKYDLAIDGSGFFGVKNGSGEIFYTRNGNFSKDADGMLINGDGEYLLGISANNIENNQVIKDPNQTIKVQKAGDEKPIHIPDELFYPPKPTTFVKFSGSLDPTIKTKLDKDGNEIQIPNLEIFRAKVFDQKNNTNLLSITFTKRVPQVGESTTWDAVAKIEDESGNPISQKSGVLEFNGYGALISNTLDSIDNNGSPLKIDLGTPYKEGVTNSGYDGISSILNAQGRSVVKDGARGGELSDYYIDEAGVLLASFTNGESIPVAKVALYHFQNEAGLSSVGGSKFQESANSGKATFFIDQKGNYVNSSRILSSKLENSNVDLTTALTELIALQKAFDANSKSITTSDQLIQNAINMKK